MSAVYPPSCSDTATDETSSKVCNQPTSVTDFRGAVTNFTYSAIHGGVETVTLPPPVSGAARPQVRTNYGAYYSYYKKNGASTISAADAPIFLPTSMSQCVIGSNCIGSAAELIEENLYSRSINGQSNNLQPDMVRARAGDGADVVALSYEYTTRGDLLNSIDSLGRALHFEYDVMRQKIGDVTFDPDGSGSLKPRARLITYDAGGLTISTKTGTVSSWNSSPTSLIELKDDQTHYDAFGRADQVRTVVGGQIQSLIEYSHDTYDRVVCTATRLNSSAFSTTSIDACSERGVGNYGRDRIVRNEYDNAGRLASISSGYGVDPIADRTVTYTENGKVKSEIDDENNKTLYVYDGLDRLKTTTYPSAAKGSLAQNASDYEQYDYDANGNRTSQRRRDGNSITWDYDALNRPKTKTLAATAASATTTFSYAYDNLGRMLSANEGGRTIVNTYDVHGRLKSETGPLGSVGYVYDAASRRTQMTWPDGAALAYEYDNTNAPTYIRRGSTVIAQFAYDDLGRRTSLTRNGVATNYGYDSALRLSSLAHDLAGGGEDVTFGLLYNPAGQITRRTISNPAYVWSDGYVSDRSYGSNGLNQMTVAGSANLQWSLRGNLQYDGAVNYKYDLENRLRGVITTGADLIYDPLGRLYQTTTASGVVTRYLYDGPNIIAEYDGSNTLLRRYVHGLGSDELLARYTGSSTDPEWLFADHQGSIVAATNSSGAILTNSAGVRKINTYDEYGAPGRNNDGLFQYTGQAWLADLSLYHYKARAYSPFFGRFLQTDPIGYQDGMNWYAYVGNDPLNRSDPTGTESKCDPNGNNCTTDPIVVDGKKPKPLEKLYSFFVDDYSRAVSAHFGPDSHFYEPKTCVYAGKQGNAPGVAQALTAGQLAKDSTNGAAELALSGDRAALQAYRSSAGGNILGGGTAGALIIGAGIEGGRAYNEYKNGKPGKIAAAGAGGRLSSGTVAGVGAGALAGSALGGLGAIPGGIIGGAAAEYTGLNDQMGAAAERAAEGC